ncbi:putative U1-type domain-containing protein [Seiridium unicorne]|uniref:U1-type domain-containing protein n=1 Tax=Seiridium unicorne TaxID=138068 RepID=A0ABR2V731_9PEZI
MATNKGSAYGEGRASDTSFRKDWDLEEYAEKAKVREAAEKEESKARWEAKQAGKKYYKPLTGNEEYTSARSRHTDFSSRVGTTTLVSGGALVGKRGKGAGIYCDACDLTFKDNIQWVEHINSKQHLHAIGQTDEVKKASARDVHERIERLWLKKEEEKLAATTSLQERLAVQAVEDEKEREAKRLKRQEATEKRRLEMEAAKEVKKEYGEDVRIEGEHDEDDMMAMMGFAGGFGSSKK